MDYAHISTYYSILLFSKFYLLFFFSHLLFQNYAMSYKFDVQKILSLKLIMASFH